MTFLKDIDEKYVPRMAAALDRVARLFPKAPEPTGPLPVILRLRRVDDRWTAAGPLALLREVPQLGAVAIAALVFTGGVTLRARMEPQNQDPAAEQSQAPDTPSPTDDGIIGPQIGDKVPAYIKQAKERLAKLGPREPDGTVVAVISFTSYRTPEQARDLVGTLQVREVFYRAPLTLPQGIVRSTPVEDVVADSKKQFRRVAALREAEAAELLKVAATIENDPVQKRDQEKDAGIFTAEATLLKGPCACVFGVVVRARLRLLVDLAGQPGVRVIDVSDVDAKLEALSTSALLPEESSVVTGGNQE